MPALSVFDMLKIGVGPSSSHTLGPWRAVQRWLNELACDVELADVDHVQIVLYGSLALTGRGHCTDKAICLALLGYDPETVPIDRIESIIDTLCSQRRIQLVEGVEIPFDPVADIHYLKSERLPYHANAMKCLASAGERRCESTYYSIGGGFVVKEGEEEQIASTVTLPFPTEYAADVLKHCRRNEFAVADMVWANEQAWRSPGEIRERLNGL